MLVIDDLTVRIAGRALLEDASARIMPGARVGLVGRNGAGKTDAVQRHRRRHWRRAGHDRAAAALAHRPAGAGSAERAGKPARGRAQGRPRAQRAAGRGRDRARSASHRRDPDPARRYRRPCGAGARGRDPVGPRLFHRRPGSARARNFPAAGACAWRSPPRCSPSPTCCCSTSRPTISISKARCGCRTIWRAIRAR